MTARADSEEAPGCRCAPDGLHAPDIALDLDGLHGPKWCGAPVLAAAAHRTGSTRPEVARGVAGLHGPEVVRC